MMKDKKSLYLLLPLVLLVWGLVAYRFWDISSEKSVGAPKKTNSLQKPLEQAKEKPRLLLNYSDPFLNVRKKKKQQNLASAAPSLTPKQLLWPSVQYKGMIQNKRKQIALLNINGKEYMLQKGEAQLGLRCLDIQKDKIVLLFGKEKRVLEK